MGSLLFDVEPDDVVTYLVATVGLIVTAAVACYWPARRVRLVDPVVALRTE
jgi:ABC-type lipoprotein release transport system permease subunit